MITPKVHHYNSLKYMRDNLTSHILRRKRKGLVTLQLTRVVAKERNQQADNKMISAKRVVTQLLLHDNTCNPQCVISLVTASFCHGDNSMVAV